MKSLIYSTFTACLFFNTHAGAQSFTYTNLVRQVQLPTGLEWSVPVDAQGKQPSALAIDPGGARFELWTTSSEPKAYLLNSCYVGTIPVATLTIRSEDTTAALPRTRADRPFYVDLDVQGISQDPKDPESTKSVKLLRHVQSYGTNGSEIGIDRTQAILHTQSSISIMGPQTLPFSVTAIPGEDRTKIRGEERFSIFSLKDAVANESQIVSKYIQVWPVADGTITGIADDAKVRFQFPRVTLTLKDLYPFSTTYAQVYKGMPTLNTPAEIVGPQWIVIQSTPDDETLYIEPKDLEKAITSDGVWTLELVTVTPFGIERLRNPGANGKVAAVWFNVDRALNVKGTFTTIE